MRTTRVGLWAAALGAVVLLAPVGEARAAVQDQLKAAGKGFVSTLVKNAVACKSKLTGVNLQSAKALVQCLGEAVKTSAKSALLGLARGLYDEFIAFLKNNAPKAKATLQDLATKVKAFVPEVDALAKPVIATVGAKATKFVTEAAKCKAQIKAIDVATAKAVFACLKNALLGKGASPATGGVTTQTTPTKTAPATPPPRRRTRMK